MPVRITQAELREAMRDARYWKPGHPERAAFNAWVTDGFRALNPRDAAPRAAVWVKAYTRNGHTVAAHWRAAPPGEEATGTATHQASGPRRSTDIPDVVQVGLLDRMLRPLRRAPSDGRGSGGSTSGRDTGQRPAPERRRWQDAAGRDRVDSIRNDRDTVPMRDAHSAGVSQYSRPGGSAGRQRDIESLSPVGDAIRRGPDVEQRFLADGRLATLRRATHPLSRGELTLEIAEPVGEGRFRPTDIFRYPPSR
ncbi:hypothetical protein J5Y09_14105 [Roseomonas sp. PWR1]|uniref:Uncharacterized protein n=1 Tax=Roseomonas nitratireducens TaxID=2820810 RepID=A0ABS4AUL1_9PROT|nr:hypothetical protein [Neoroseomonas nitratireducens]MBP0465053.1 hypothetical protein [Neoroseomonas nitratireducens]